MAACPVQGRQVRARPAIGGLHPFAEVHAVGGEMEIVRVRLDLHGFANQPHPAGVGLQEADLRMTVHRETPGRVREHQRTHIRRRNLGRRHHPLARRIGCASGLAVPARWSPVRRRVVIPLERRTCDGLSAATARPIWAEVLDGGEVPICEDES